MTGNSLNHQGVHEGRITAALVDETIVVITIRDSYSALDLNQLPNLFQELMEKGFRRYVIDLSSTRLLNSHEIGAIVHQTRLLANHGGIVFVNPSERVQYMLELSCATPLAPLAESVEEAVALLKELP
ncbi:MAG TPA: STAS domain-containing protein [bacterium]|nr:STAS domain-containing protein [Candidatus Omnitrophota bacterium]HOJ59667.1 STAS domain-containing protein [bacterium]HOL95671.1 STAS domain-containing protein [bacterium]HPP01032.1 STAS domain-containing protein [bacterium]HXK94985.1 STAS domain-containing protein [bacterium]